MAGWGADQGVRGQGFDNTEGAVISKHRLLHCDTEHSYSPVPWKDGVGGWGGQCQNNHVHINNNDNNYPQAQ